MLQDDQVVGNETLETTMSRAEAQSIVNLMARPEWRVYQELIDRKQRGYQALLLSRTPNAATSFEYEFGRLQWPANNLYLIVTSVVEEALSVLNE